MLSHAHFKKYFHIIYQLIHKIHFKRCIGVKNKPTMVAFGGEIKKIYQKKKAENNAKIQSKTLVSAGNAAVNK